MRLLVTSGAGHIGSVVALPFAGYLISQGQMGFFATVAGVLGNLLGSWVAYFVGLWGGPRAVVYSRSPRTGESSHYSPYRFVVYSLKLLTFLTGKTELSHPKWGSIVRR